MPDSFWRFVSLRFRVYRPSDGVSLEVRLYFCRPERQRPGSGTQKEIEERGLASIERTRSSRGFPKDRLDDELERERRSSRGDTNLLAHRSISYVAPAAAGVRISHTDIHGGGRTAGALPRVCDGPGIGSSKIVSGLGEDVPDTAHMSCLQKAPWRNTLLERHSVKVTF
jgi:hypothetical protein